MSFNAWCDDDDRDIDDDEDGDDGGDGIVGYLFPIGHKGLQGKKKNSIVAFDFCAYSNTWETGVNLTLDGGMDE